MPWNGKKFKMTIDVCKDCTEREIGCHSICEKYINAKKELEELKSIIRAEKYKVSDYNNHRFETVRKRKAERERKSNKKVRR